MGRPKRSRGDMTLERGGAVISNRNHKDTVFRKLFSDPERLLSLYNALHHTAYTDSEGLTVVTLDAVIYMSMKNDVAFIIDSRLMLYEHQSTYNPNMPLRNLLYISAEYQKLVVDETLYSSKLLKLPTPYFVVFYNGTDAMPDVTELKLSDAFIKEEERPDLQLIVRVLNINEGHNKELLKQCETLSEYCRFVEKVRRYAEQSNIDEAVEAAVNECVREDILKEFLLQNKAEVIAMSIFEYNEEEELKKIRRDEREIGLEKGIQVGFERGLEKGTKEGIEQGLTMKTREIAVTMYLKKISPEVIQDILNIHADILKEWLKDTDTSGSEM